MMVAGDTFRAGAIEQLEVWSKRAGVDFFAKQAGLTHLPFYMMPCKRLKKKPMMSYATQQAGFKIKPI